MSAQLQEARNDQALRSSQVQSLCREAANMELEADMELEAEELAANMELEAEVELLPVAELPLLPVAELPPVAEVEPPAQGIQCTVFFGGYVNNILVYNCGHFISSEAYEQMTVSGDAIFVPECPTCKQSGIADGSAAHAAFPRMHPQGGLQCESCMRRMPDDHIPSIWGCGHITCDQCTNARDTCLACNGVGPAHRVFPTVVDLD